jgi:hypothetical protein
MGNQQQNESTDATQSTPGGDKHSRPRGHAAGSGSSTGDPGNPRGSSTRKTAVADSDPQPAGAGEVSKGG